MAFANPSLALSMLAVLIFPSANTEEKNAAAWRNEVFGGVNPARNHLSKTASD